MDNFRDNRGRAPGRPAVQGFVHDRSRMARPAHAYLQRPPASPASVAPAAPAVPQSAPVAQPQQSIASPSAVPFASALSAAPSSPNALRPPLGVSLDISGPAAYPKNAPNAPAIAAPQKSAAPSTVTKTPVTQLSPVSSQPLSPVVSTPKLIKQKFDSSAPPATDKAAKAYPKIDMTLPGAEELIKQQPHIRRNKFYRIRTWVFRGVLAALVLVIVVGGILFAQGFMKVNKVFKGTSTAAALKKDVAPHTLKGEGDGRINILLLGTGGVGHDGADLTDTIMVASIDPVTKAASLVSVPRDLWVQSDSGAMKINAIFATSKYKALGRVNVASKDPIAIKAGLSSLDDTVESVLGIKIHYNVMLDFKAFKQAIDTVGGVDVNVPEALVDPTMAWENNRNSTLAPAGLQTMDGKKALMYVRSRHTSSDFARSERQRAVLLALKDKVVSLGTLSNPLKISELINAFGDNVYTDLSLADTTALYKIFKGINNTNVKSIGLTDNGNSFVTTAMVGDQSTVQPRAGMFDFSEIKTYIRGQLADGYIKKENARVLVLNGTEQEGLATEISDLLKSYGYNVVKADNAPTNTYGQTVIVDRTGGKSPYTKNYLEKRFNVKATTKLPDSAILPGDADFIIILGSNEAINSQN